MENRMKTIRRQPSQHDEKILSYKRQMGINRKEHFQNGGTLDSWRGTHTVSQDAQKEESKFACRGSFIFDEENSHHEDDWSGHLGEE
jgi:hypothetical protein